MNIATPLVSVLMTSYNRQAYIGFAIQSVLNSTFTDIELIIVDDGSKDNTVSIAKEFAAKDERVRVYQNEKNLGDYPNRNKAASYARGKYIKYVDSDDLIYPWALQILFEVMEKFPGAGWGLCSMEANDNRIFPFELNPRESYEYHYKGPGLFRRAPLSAIIRRDVFNEVNGFKPIRMAGDYEMWHRLAQRYNVVLMPQGMVWYRKHGSQEINDYSQFMNVYEKLKVDFLKSADCPLTVDDRKEVLKIEKRKIRRSIMINILRLNFKILKVNITNYRFYN